MCNLETTPLPRSHERGYVAAGVSWGESITFGRSLPEPTWFLLDKKGRGRSPSETAPATPKKLKGGIMKDEIPQTTLLRRRRTMTVVRLKASRPQVAGSGTV